MAAHMPGAESREREVKLVVPEPAWEALREEMSGPDAAVQDLHALYYDTADGRLAACEVALRLRSDGRQWVQTLKAPGAGALERIEDEVAVGAVHEGQARPVPELDRHRSEDAQRVLRAALELRRDEPWPALQAVYEVRVRRRTRRVVQGRSRIELALDEGQLRAGGAHRELRELELELVHGELVDLLALARRWRRRFGLWVGTASKAARAQRLARGERFAPPRHAVPPRFAAKPGMGDFTAAVLDSCLEQVLANAGELAEGSPDDEHVHELRVGLRRLRTALRELPGLGKDAAAHEAALVRVFRRLGERRDRTHVMRRIQPRVEAAGGAPVRDPAALEDGADPAALVRDDDFQDALLALLASSERLRRSGGKGVRRTLAARLSSLHGKVTREGRRFTRLEEGRQHRVRKRLKRLRYLSEFAAPLYDARSVEAFLARLKPAQDALGQYNDEIIAQGLYEELARGDDPGARFGAEWLQGQRAGEARACRKALRQLEDAKPFWKR
ncbi:CHAD domain-containing protein [Ramlibacter rhizophilus]|uniref:CHAD domain-containing protein n=1 Tax=Ramlibacter rhizophilus TaxID=1781167 RepID=A0A4Z0BH11_9BURK|nr:CHAD domain-containing protein [Ramlibacter rhizophilus]TFY98616.1 CHAD domain-containing protein [Ramlibacter rhizophilus]